MIQSEDFPEQLFYVISELMAQKYIYNSFQ
jgi:hypothetical protein